MVICKDLNHIQHFEQSILTIGSMDGMHRGHSEIISYIKDVSIINNVPSVVITFDPHPKTVLHPDGQSMRWLLGLDKKMEFLEKNSIDYVWVIPFNRDFSQISAGDFMTKYIIDLFNPVDIIIGYDHHFGFKRKGNKDFLNNCKKVYNYNLHVIEPILYNDIPISSSRIRTYLNNCNIIQANECLGRQYEISGKIVKGQGRGAKLGFPTANIQPHISNQLIPSHGVYCIDALIEDTYYTGMCNIGQRPTFYNNGKDVIEVHLFSNDELNLYEKNIDLKFKKYLREERKYSSSSDLIQQLEFDREVCFTL